MSHSHSHGNRADETPNVNDESITILTEAALAVGSTAELNEAAARGGAPVVGVG